MPLNMLNRRLHTIFVLFLLLLLSMVLSTSIGVADISPADTAGIIAERLLGMPAGEEVEESWRAIVLNIRLPRVLLGVLVGASLAAAGVAFQGLLQNPLADPYTIGVSSGAAVGATLAFLLPVGALVPQVLTIPVFGFLGGGAALFTVYQLARVGGKVPVVTLLLAGVVISSFLSAVISILMIFSGEALRGIFFWLAGGLAGRGWTQVAIVAPYFTLCSAVLFYYTRDLNLILMGEEAASSLGVEVERVKKIVLITASGITAAAVSVSGMIGFAGLIVPHAMRIIVGPDHRYLLPASILAGAIFLLWADVLARMFLAPSEIPVGIITAFLGAPFFMYLLRKKREDYRF